MELSMEDFYDARIDATDGKLVGMFGVYDGHRGAIAAEYVMEHLLRNLIKHPKFITEIKAAITEDYNHTDSEFLKIDHSKLGAGSTAVTATIVGGRLLVANVGDSRAVICKGGQAIMVSRDHKPDQPDERQRIEDAGGFVMWEDGKWRVGGVVPVSRAFGHKLLKQYAVADPEIKEVVVDSSLEFVILASRGLWDVVSIEEAVAIAKTIQDPEDAARRLLIEAYKRETCDNTTVAIVRFLHENSKFPSI